MGHHLMIDKLVALGGCTTPSSAITRPNAAFSKMINPGDRSFHDTERYLPQSTAQLVV